MLKVERMDGLRIDRLSLKLLDRPEEQPPATGEEDE